MAEQRERKIGMFTTDDGRKLTDVLGCRPQTALAELAQFAGIARSLLETRGTVAAVVVGIHRVAGGDERLRDVLVATGVIA